MKKILFLLTITFSITFFVYADNISGPVITLKNTVTSIEVGKQVKVNVNFSEPVIRFDRGQVSVDGASLESVRKLGPYSYLLFLRASENSKEINIQIEADKVQNSSKVYNDTASNEVTIKIIQLKPVAPVSTDKEIAKILDTVVSASQLQTQQVQQAQPVQYSQPQVTYINCYGVNIPSTQQCMPPTNSYNYSGYYDTYGNYYTTTPTYTTPMYNSNVYYSPYSSYGSSYYDTEEYYISTPKRSRISDWLDW